MLLKCMQEQCWGLQLSWAAGMQHCRSQLCPMPNASCKMWELGFQQKAILAGTALLRALGCQKGSRNTCLQLGYLLKSKLDKESGKVTQTSEVTWSWLWNFKTISVTAFLFTSMVNSGLLLTGNGQWLVQEDLTKKTPTPPKPEQRFELRGFTFWNCSLSWGAYRNDPEYSYNAILSSFISSFTSAHEQMSTFSIILLPEWHFSMSFSLLKRGKGSSLEATEEHGETAMKTTAHRAASLGKLNLCDLL